MYLVYDLSSDTIKASGCVAVAAFVDGKILIDRLRNLAVEEAAADWGHINAFLLDTPPYLLVPDAQQVPTLERTARRVQLVCVPHARHDTRSRVSGAQAQEGR